MFNAVGIMMDQSGGKSFVNAKQVAELAGVSRSAVSRAFTPGASISEEKRRRIVMAAEQLGYHVNHLARGLMGVPSGIVCIVVSELDTPYQSRLVRRLVEQLQAEGRIAVVLAASVAASSLQAALTRALNYRAEATVVLSGSPSQSIVRTCVESGQRLLLINRDDRMEGTYNLRTDNEMAARTALHAFLRAGCRRLAVVTSQARTPSLVAREEAFRAAADGEGLDVRVWAQGPTGYASGLAGAKALLAGRDRPDAVFCVTDLLACGFMDGARQSFGLRVPQEICVIGFDDIDQAEWEAYRLTTFRPPLDEMVRQVVDLVVMPNGSLDVSRESLLEPTFVWRSSVRPAHAEA
ncbi:LacI family transcriptional regulator [Breoghania corrubedonensis]|uniref:LacI family transcriptional regulator n=2 Tax=Breoghania corrubedonensis TaxID=665038 RepID=A0A2T5V9Y1_9HYPH|nr:LacI family transcriptional regulator [Breoghania corrubedonensis]